MVCLKRLKNAAHKYIRVVLCKNKLELCKQELFGENQLIILNIIAGEA